MKKNEFLVWAAALQTYYPRFNMLPNDQAMSLWYGELQDIPADVLTAALKKWVLTEKWPPSIAEIRGMCDNVVNGDRPDWGEGWQEVQKAIRRYGYMQPDEALASMNPITRDAVKRIGWQSICESENPEAIRAQFRQVYEFCEKRSHTEQVMPERLRQTIQTIRIGSSGPVLLEGETEC